MEVPKESLPTKIKGFWESGITWGALGALVGAVIVLVPIFALKWIFVTAGIALFVRVWMASFFEGKSRLERVFGNLALGLVLAVVLTLSWHFIPKPKEPPEFPSPDQIASAVWSRATGKALPSTDPSTAFADAIYQRLKQSTPVQQEQKSSTPAPLEKLVRSLLAERLSGSAGEVGHKLATIGQEMHRDIDVAFVDAPMGTKKDYGVIRRKYSNDVVGATKQAHDCQLQALQLLPSSLEDKNAAALMKRMLSWDANNVDDNDVRTLADYFGRLQKRLDEAAKL
jgi:hypothetical protein